MNRAIVLGGTNDHIELAQKLRKLNFFVIIIDYLPNPIAKREADLFINESVTDKNKVLDIAKEYKVSFISSICSEAGMLTSAYVSDELKIPTLVNYETIKLCTNKSSMKDVLLKSKILTPRVFDLKEIKTKKDLHVLPVVVKPVDSNSSKGITKINNFNFLDEGIELAKKYSKQKKIIIEEYIKGREFSIDGYIINKNFHLLCISELKKIQNKKHFTINECAYVDNIAENIFDQICLSAQKIIENFNLKNGPLLIQGIIKDDDFFVLEFSPRIGGGSKNQFVHTLTENNMMQLYLNQCLNQNKIIIKKEKKYHSALMKYYYFNGSYYKETKNIKTLLKEKVILKSFLYKNNKTHINNHKYSSDRILGVLIASKNNKSMISKIDKIENDLIIADNENKDRKF